RVRGRGIGVDGTQQGSGPFLRVGMYVSDPRAVLRDLGAGRRLGAGAFVDPIRAPSFLDRGRGGFRRQTHGRGRPSAARDVAALRDGEGRRRSEISAVESGIAAERPGGWERPWLIATR